MSDGDVHVYPLDDLIEHDRSGAPCVCGPETEPIERDDGSIGYVIVHHSLDDRERFEKSEEENPNVR